METVEINNLVFTSYNNAKAKGFFTQNYPDEAYVAAIHDELSEAFEAWNKTDEWYKSIPAAKGTSKLEGIYPELADAIIRLFSYCGYKGINLRSIAIETDRPHTQNDFCDVILKSHQSLVEYYDLINREPRDEHEQLLLLKCCTTVLSTFVRRIELFIEESSDYQYNLSDIISDKLAYNATRDIKHGGHKV